MIIAGNWKLMATSQSGEGYPIDPGQDLLLRGRRGRLPRSEFCGADSRCPDTLHWCIQAFSLALMGLDDWRAVKHDAYEVHRRRLVTMGLWRWEKGRVLLVGGSNEGLHHRMYVCSLRESTLDSAWRWGKQALIERSPSQCGGLRSGCVGEHSYGWGPCQGTRPGHRAPAPAPCTACKVQFESLSGGRMWWRTGSLSRLAESCLWPWLSGCEAWKSWLGSRSVLDLSCRGDWSHLPPGRNTIATGRSVIEGRQSIQCSWTQVLQAGIRHPINACGRGASGFGNCTPDQLRREKAKVWFYVDQVNGSVDYSIFGTMHLCADGGIG